MTVNKDTPLQDWPIERGQSDAGMKVARIDTPYGWFCVAPSDTLNDADMRMMAGVFIAGRDGTFAEHRAAAPYKPVPDTGLNEN